MEGSVSGARSGEGSWGEGDSVEGVQKGTGLRTSI